MARLKLFPVFFFISFLLCCNNPSENARQNLGPTANFLSELNEIENIEKFPNTDFNFISLTQGIKHTIPAIPILFNDPLQVPDFGIEISNSLYNARENPVTLIHYAYRLLSATAGGFGPPLPTNSIPGDVEITQENMDQILLQLVNLSGLLFAENDYQEWEKLSSELKIETLKTVYALQETYNILEQFKEPVMSQLCLHNSDEVEKYYTTLIKPWHNRQLTEFSSIDVIKNADLKKLSFASRILTEQIMKLINVKNRQPDNDFSKCIIESQLGKIGIFGMKSDTITDDYCLIINLGGDDIYSGNIASTISLDKPVKIVIDFKGHDKYLCEDGFLAAGIFGIGMLFDLNGDDSYISGNAGIASSLYGTSVLYDASGNDTYQNYSGFSQGSAHIGAALLIDLKGDDKYFSKSYSQAYGGTLGVGILLDNAGNDLYNDFESENRSPSLSFVQGAASGRWAEATDGQSIGGGYGIFIDYSGDDHYYAKSFSQGAAYYFGIGIFYEHSGDDQYNALSHSQGYAAHYALASFTEKKGNDMYNKQVDVDQISQIMGSGRDLSAGWFIESEGDDTYHFGNRSAGIGDINGIGVLWDRMGNDQYIWYKNKIYSGTPSLGQSVGLNENMKIDFRIFKSKNDLNKGIFLDTNGTNKFETH